MQIDENEVANVRRLLAASKGRRNVSLEAKQAAARLARKAKLAGAAVSAVAERIGVKVNTLHFWTRTVPEPSAGFALARVIDSSAASQGLIVQHPSGLRVWGLSVAQVAELLGRLSCSA